jgi:hypothetical protein
MSISKFWISKAEGKVNLPLIFIHTPKCGGTYASTIFKDLKIINKGHNLAFKNEGLNFTIIRDPIERFESLLNYRLADKHPRPDWPKHLHCVYDNKEISLSEIVSKMSDDEIIGFTPYKSLVYWSKNIDIFITIDQLHDFLNTFGYAYNPNNYVKQNVSIKTRGKLNDETRKRIEKLYQNDVLLFNNVINKDY